MKTTVNSSSVHFTAAIIIRRGVHCTLRATFTRFHIICYRIPSRHQCCHHHLHHQTISLHEYPRHPLHYVSQRTITPSDINVTPAARTVEPYLSYTNCQIQPNECDKMKPTQQGYVSRNHLWQLRRSTRACLSHITSYQRSYEYERYTETNGGIIAQIRNVAFHDTKNFIAYLHIMFLHIKYVGSN